MFTTQQSGPDPPFRCPNPQCPARFHDESLILSHLTSDRSCTLQVIDQWMAEGRTDASFGASQDNSGSDRYDEGAGEEAMPTAQPGPSSANTADSLQSSRRAAFHVHDPIPAPVLPVSETSPLPRFETRDDGRATAHTVPPGATRVLHANTSAIWSGGPGHLLNQVASDPCVQTGISSGNIHYPFANRMEWELAQWLETSGLSDVDKDRFLKLDYVTTLQEHQISFASARELRIRVESLPKTPQWHSIVFDIPGFQTEEPMQLFFKHGIEVIAAMYANPIFANCIDHTAYRDIRDNNFVWGEFMSADLADHLQSCLHDGETLLGIITSSDKTPLTVGTGNKQMYPFLLGLANIHGAVRLKASSHAYSVAAYLPTPKFRNVPAGVQSTLASRVYHFCVDIVTQSLKDACRRSQFLPGPDGKLRLCRTPLVASVDDRPEQVLIACTMHNQSSVTHATSKQFGDGKLYPPRTRNDTLALINQAISECPDVNNIPRFYRVCQRLGLSGVTDPFWRDWGSDDFYMACPSDFLVPELLHTGHKFFWDHPVKWVKQLMKQDNEIDFRLMALPLRTGIRSWSNGITGLKQVTGAMHRDIQHVLAPIMHGSENVPYGVYTAILLMIEYLRDSHKDSYGPDDLTSLTALIDAFHVYKNAILEAKARRGEKGNVLEHFENIPKLELLLGIVPSIRRLGAIYPYTADATERTHQHSKFFFRHTNKAANYRQQVAQQMYRQDCLRQFDLFLSSWLDDEARPIDPSFDLTEYAQELILQGYPEKAWRSQHGLASMSVRSRVSLFASGWSFNLNTSHATAVSLRSTPHYPEMSLVEAAKRWRIPDMLSLLRHHVPGDRILGISHLNIWVDVHFQARSRSNSRIILPAQRIAAEPISKDLPYGLCNTILIGTTVQAMAPATPYRCALTTEPSDEGKEKLF
ncbi:unnamed protein product [Peniophora sp. CBMAI 1063]|nr:unnamed protein product [Peniophora sp. CBMAI 1063]